MAKGPRITDEVIKLIAQVYLEYPNWRAKEIQSEVNARLYNANPRLNPGWPGLSAVQKELTKIRRRDAMRHPESKRIDERWSIGTLAEFNIPPEAIPKVFQIQQNRRDAEKPQTIRQAMWAGRLHMLIEDIGELSLLAASCALMERVCELADIPNDTFNTDYFSVKYPLASSAFILTQLAPEPSKEGLANSIYEMEGLLGLDLDRPSFSHVSWLYYGNLLTAFIEKIRKKEKPPDEELRQAVLDMRETAQLFGEQMIKPSLQSKFDTISKEFYNERTHSQKR